MSDQIVGLYHIHQSSYGLPYICNWKGYKSPFRRPGHICSIVNKFKIFQDYVYSRFPYVIGVTETWLSNKIYDNEILPSNYSLIHKDRGDGVMLVVHNSKSYKVLSSPLCLEVLSVSIGSSSPIIYCLVHIPPNSSEEYLIEFFKTIYSHSTVLLITYHYLVMSVLMILIGTPSPASAKFCDIILDLNLSQLICEPTHIAGNMLDLILTNIPDHIFNVNVHSVPPLSIPSDHYIITFDVQTLNHDVHNRATTSFDFTKGDYDSLC